MASVSLTMKCFRNSCELMRRYAKSFYGVWYKLTNRAPDDVIKKLKSLKSHIMAFSGSSRVRGLGNLPPAPSQRPCLHTYIHTCLQSLRLLCLIKRDTAAVENLVIESKVFVNRTKN